MTTRYACTLNGVSLDSLDPCIHITDLTELAPRQRIVTAPAARHGLHVLQRVRESLTVRIRFILREYEPTARRNALQKVYAWANDGGLLTISDRPGQHLQVVCDTLPGMSAMTWLDELELSFTAYQTPFWEATQRTTVTTSYQGVLSVPGTADEAPVSCQVVNLGSAGLSALSISVGSTAMTFTNMSIPAGSTFVMTVADGVLSVTSGSADLLMNRSADSADLLLAPCGADSDVYVSADQSVMATFSARGRYL